MTQGNYVDFKEFHDFAMTNKDEHNALEKKVDNLTTQVGQNTAGIRRLMLYVVGGATVAGTGANVAIQRLIGN